MRHNTTPRHSAYQAVAIAALMGCATLAQAADDTTAPTRMEKAEHKVEQSTSDTWITTKVKSEILANSVSKAFKVEVETKKGMVTLKGALASQDAIDLVKMIAEKVKGVHGVDTTGMHISG